MPVFDISRREKSIYIQSIGWLRFPTLVDPIELSPLLVKDPQLPELRQGKPKSKHKILAIKYSLSIIIRGNLRVYHQINRRRIGALIFPEVVRPD